MKFPSKTSTSDVEAETKPHYEVDLWKDHPRPPVQKKVKRSLYLGCSLAGFLFVFLVFIGAIYFLFPTRLSILILGIDRAPVGTSLGRSDTNILITMLPLRPYVGILSIPRDLWVEIPGFGENRINTAHFFAENQEPGSGPAAALDTVNHNFKVDVRHFIRIKFDGLVHIVDAAGGFKLTLAEPLGGLPAGKYLLTGDETLAFVRDRQGTDDFYRMRQGQIFLTQFSAQLLNPFTWPRLPALISALSDSIDTNVPFWLWPRILFTMMRVGSGDMDTRVITREMVNPFTTSEGAQVLLPDWTKILPVVEEMFGP
jgi:LCP family protein required for cell wall assembly